MDVLTWLNPEEQNSKEDDWFYLLTKQIGLDDDDDEDQMKWMASFPEAWKKNSS